MAHVCASACVCVSEPVSECVKGCVCERQSERARARERDSLCVREKSQGEREKEGRMDGAREGARA